MLLLVSRSQWCVIHVKGLESFIVYQRTCKHLGGLTTAGGHPVGTIVIFGLGSLSSCIVSIVEL